MRWQSRNPPTPLIGFFVSFLLPSRSISLACSSSSSSSSSSIALIYHCFYLTFLLLQRFRFIFHPLPPPPRPIQLLFLPVWRSPSHLLITLLYSLIDRNREKKTVRRYTRARAHTHKHMLIRRVEEGRNNSNNNTTTTTTTTNNNNNNNRKTERLFGSRFYLYCYNAEFFMTNISNWILHMALSSWGAGHRMPATFNGRFQGR